MNGEDSTVAERELGQNLLSFLRRTLNLPAVEFEEPPEEIALGTESQILKFALRSVPRKYRSPLVLRISIDIDFPVEARVEHAAQNTLFKQGFPAPPVLASSQSGDELGRSFVIMAHVGPEGLWRPRTRLARMGIRLWKEARRKPGKAVVARPRELLIQTLAHLHSLDSRPLRKSFEEQGVPDRILTQSVRFTQTQNIIDTWSIEQMSPLMSWLEAHAPAEPGNSICHGDCHEGNLIFSDGRVAAMIDWGSVGIRHPESDLGLLCGYRRCNEPLGESLEMQEKFDQNMLAEYKRYRPVNEQLVRFYETEQLISYLASVADQRCRQAAGQEPPANPLLDNPETPARLANRLKILVGSDVPIPEGFGA